MTMLQLNPLIPVETPQGRGMAHLVIDYGPETHLLWTVFLDANGECWTFQNAQVRLQANPTMRPALTDSKPGIADMLPRMVDNSRPNADRRPADIAQRMGERMRAASCEGSMRLGTGCGKCVKCRYQVYHTEAIGAKITWCKGSIALGTGCDQCEKCWGEHQAIQLLKESPRADKELAKANQQRAQQEEMLKKQPPEEDKPTPPADTVPLCGGSTVSSPPCGKCAQCKNEVDQVSSLMSAHFLKKTYEAEQSPGAKDVTGTNAP